MPRPASRSLGTIRDSLFEVGDEIDTNTISEPVTGFVFGATGA